ncbi:MAG: class I SAM-dependent methyltransferase [Chloroflexota bacterium]
MTMHMYSDLASWFHLITAPDEYQEEEAIYSGAIIAASSAAPRTILELGAGGGNLAWQYKHRFTPTLTDISPDMLEQSRSINPECEHILGDMRTLRLGRTFDAVLAHDAVMYLTAENDLRQAIETAFLHCAPGGVALFAPDCVKETFQSSTDHGGNDSAGRALRFLAWSYDPDPADTTFMTEFVLILREDGQPTRTVHDQHEEGLFSRLEWLRWLSEAGFQPTVHPLIHSEVEPGTVEYFVAVRPT